MPPPFVRPDARLEAHRNWLGFLQPDGLVVSAAALDDLAVDLDRPRALRARDELEARISEISVAGDTEAAVPVITGLPGFLRDFLEWPEQFVDGLAADRPVPDTLKVHLKDYEETLAPAFAVRERDPKDAAKPWMLLGLILPAGTDFDARTLTHSKGWEASPAQRLERLLRDTGVSAGLILNGTHFRLVSAPRGENAGALTFPLAPMRTVAGRDILAALLMLLHADRLFTGDASTRLPGILAKSRDIQGRVSNDLAGQVLDALYELLRGFQSANDKTHGVLLRNILKDNPDEIYAGLLAVLMRLVFLLYAEDRNLLPTSELFEEHYSLHALFEQLRTERDQYPDTMDARFGAWSRLLAVFRAVHGGSGHAKFKVPARQGHLFDPDRHPFLEGRTEPDLPVPRVPDGVVLTVLEKLLVLKNKNGTAERLSYRTLDVEQIGSVYETMMGFRLLVADGPSVALKPAKAGGAPVVVNLEDLLGLSGKERTKWLLENADAKLGKQTAALESAVTQDDLIAAFGKRIAFNATPAPVAKGALLLQPSDARRRSGSHYTPRSLTEPIVRKALQPILARLGDTPTSAEILELKVCDPAVGSGAFLVEAGRQLADALVRAWQTHGDRPTIPPDEDEILHARRLVAQRCLYGVDRNPMAVDLAKLSLWLATLAQDHPFTFLDHALRHGDSLVGLSAKQLAAFTWRDDQIHQRALGEDQFERRVKGAAAYRREILTAGDLILPGIKSQKLKLADDQVKFLRFAGDLAVKCFFDEEKDKARESRRQEVQSVVISNDFEKHAELERTRQIWRSGDLGVVPFHWEIEYPEIFDRPNPGFDCIVGNPPYAGSVQVGESNTKGYTDFLRNRFTGTGGRSDLIAYFFRNSFNIIRNMSTIGFVSTKTICQGDTRESSLTFIRENGGTIFNSNTKFKWPGSANVYVVTIHIQKTECNIQPELNGKNVEKITAYLFHEGPDRDPREINNEIIAGHGVKPYGMGFVFEETGKESNPLHKLESIKSSDGRLPDCIRRFVGGDDLNNNWQMCPNRFIIDFGLKPLDEIEQKWPECLKIVEEKVKPQRMRLTTQSGAESLRSYWWRFGYNAQELINSIGTKKNLIVVGQNSKYFKFSLLPSNWTYDQKVVVFSSDSNHLLSVLNSRIHEIWALFFGGSIGETPVYTAPSCFHTFPLPNKVADNDIEETGISYYSLRKLIQSSLKLGITETYNYFHNPNEVAPDILELRSKHAAMDAAVLRAYGWADLAARAADPTTCQFIPDFIEIDENTGEEVPKNIRYRWPDDLRDEVLARLLALNAERAAAEVKAAAAANGPAEGKRQKAKGKSPTTTKPTKATGATPPAVSRPAKATQIGLDLHDDAPLFDGHKGDDPVTSSATRATPSEVETRLLADLLKLLQDRGSLSSSEAQAALGLDAATLRPGFAFLIASGLVRTEGERRGMRYIAVK